MQQVLGMLVGGKEMMVLALEMGLEVFMMEEEVRVMVE